MHIHPQTTTYIVSFVFINIWYPSCGIFLISYLENEISVYTLLLEWNGEWVEDGIKLKSVGFDDRKTQVQTIVTSLTGYTAPGELTSPNLSCLVSKMEI